VPCHAYAALVACHLGFADRARAASDTAIAMARRLGRPIDIGFALQVSAFLYVTLRDPARVAAAAAELGTIGAEHGFPMQSALATIFDAWARAETGCLSEGAGGVRNALHQLAIAKTHISRGFNIGMLAEIEARLGALPEALQTSEDALGAAPEDAVYRPDLLRVRAELLARSGAGLDVVEPVLRESIAVARKQGARFLELRAATRLGELLAAAGRGAEARALVADVYEQLTEGFDVPDLRDAAAFLGVVDDRRSSA
jgi:predicted ATPase